MANTKTVILGRLPAFIGEYVEGHPYSKFNKVVYYGAEFTSTIDGNTTPPATITLDSSGAMQSYIVNPGWKMSSNSYDGSIYLKNITDHINLTYNFTPGYEVVQDSSTVNPIYKYLKYNAQTLTAEEQRQARENIGAAGSEDTWRNFQRVAFFSVVETI